MNDSRPLPAKFSTGGRRLLSLLFAFVVLLPAASCHLQDDTVQTRAHFAEESVEPIRIGIAWPFSVGRDLYREGVTMALDEINQSGGLLGRKLEARFGDDRSSSREGLAVAQDFAKDPRLLYVVGHCDAHVTQAASIIYQANSILFITPGTTAFRSTRQGFNLAFNSYHTREEIIGALVSYCKRSHYRRIALVFQNTSYGSGLADVFENLAGEAEMEIVARLPYNRPDPRVVRQMVTTLRESEGADAVFVAGLMPEAAHVVATLRQSGMTLPLVGVDDLDVEEYTEIAGAAAEGTVIPSSFHPSSQRPEAVAFVRNFEARYGTPPDPWAAEGYDAVNLLAFAVRKTGSAVPAKVAAVLGKTEGWLGATGPHTFNDRGEVVGKPLVLKQVQEGKFVFLEEAAPLKRQ